MINHFCKTKDWDVPALRERVTTTTVMTGASRTNLMPASAVVVKPSKVDNLEELRRTVDDTLSRADGSARSAGTRPGRPRV